MNIPDYKDLDASEMFIVDWQYRMLGDFKQALVSAIARADSSNLEKLRLGFPDEVQGYINYAEVEGWWEKTKKKAGITID